MGLARQLSKAHDSTSKLSTIQTHLRTTLSTLAALGVVMLRTKLPVICASYAGENQSPSTSGAEMPITANPSDAWRG
jgi:hypothetical protein